MNAFDISSVIGIVCGFLLIFCVIVACVWAERLPDEDYYEYEPSEYERAREFRQQAQHNFEQADPDHVDIAIYELQASELKVGHEIRKLRVEAQK